MGCKVLVVDDHPAILEAVTRLLTVHGHTVSVAATVQEALAELDGQDAAVLDLNLPDGTGTDVLRRVRADGRHTRVAVWTASLDPEATAEARTFAPDAVFRKPNDIQKMLDWVGACALLAGVEDAPHVLADRRAEDVARPFPHIAGDIASRSMRHPASAGGQIEVGTISGMKKGPPKVA